MLAGAETSGVACRSFQHTLIALLALEEQLTGTSLDLVARVRQTADATEWLLEHRAEWLAEAAERLDGPSGVWFLAPAERISSALQAALMVREGPRPRVRRVRDRRLEPRRRVPDEDPRLPRAGVRRQSPRRRRGRWMRQRGSTVVAVGGPFDGAQQVVRFPGDDDPVVLLLTEVLVAELIAATWWSSP